MEVTTEAKAKRLYMLGKQDTSRGVSLRLDVIMHGRSESVLRNQSHARSYNTPYSHMSSTFSHHDGLNVDDHYHKSTGFELQSILNVILLYDVYVRNPMHTEGNLR